MAQLSTNVIQILKGEDVLVKEWVGEFASFLDAEQKWVGDSCGCTSPVCIGLHHEDKERCPCFSAQLDLYLRNKHNHLIFFKDFYPDLRTQIEQTSYGKGIASVHQTLFTSLIEAREKATLRENPNATSELAKINEDIATASKYKNDPPPSDLRIKLQEQFLHEARLCEYGTYCKTIAWEFREHLQRADEPDEPDFWWDAEDELVIAHHNYPGHLTIEEWNIAHGAEINVDHQTFKAIEYEWLHHMGDLDGSRRGRVYESAYDKAETAKSGSFHDYHLLQNLYHQVDQTFVQIRKQLMDDVFALLKEEATKLGVRNVTLCDSKLFYHTGGRLPVLIAAAVAPQLRPLEDTVAMVIAGKLNGPNLNHRDTFIIDRERLKAGYIGSSPQPSSPLEQLVEERNRQRRP